MIGDATMLYPKFLVVLGVATATTAAALQASAGKFGVCNGCGENTAVVADGVIFDELNVYGQARGDGPRIVAARLPKHDGSVQILVVGDELYAVAKEKWLKRSDISGLQVMLETAGMKFVLEFRYVEGQTFWALPRKPVPAYEVLVRTSAPGSTTQRLCTGRHLPPTVDDPRINELRFTAIVHEGDHYGDKHVVTAESENGWFNLACYGTAASKMHLLRHTKAGGLPGRTPTLNERTAMLRAITADYCSDGRAWTGEGTPLLWTDRRQLFPLAEQPGYSLEIERGQMEAVWSRDGDLLCLNDPRRTPGPGIPSPECSEPAVRRENVMEDSIACQKQVPKCFPTTIGEGWPLLSTDEKSYVVTFKPTPLGDYCNKDAEQISWPAETWAPVATPP